MSNREALQMPGFDDLDDFAPRETAPQPARETTAPEAPATASAPEGARGSDQDLVSGPEPTPDPVKTPDSGAGRPPASAFPRAADTRRAIDAVSQFPSREASTDGQLNLKGPRHVLDRFRVMCKADRRAYYDMLEILMDRYEGKG